MQTLIAQSAFRRGLQMFAGLLAGQKSQPIHTHDATPSVHRDLVSWCSEARTRRGDEMARSQRLKSAQDY